MPPVGSAAFLGLLALWAGGPGYAAFLPAVSAVQGKTSLTNPRPGGRGAVLEGPTIPGPTGPGGGRRAEALNPRNVWDATTHGWVKACK